MAPITRKERGRRVRYRMVVGFTTTYAIESRTGRGVQHYVIKSVRDSTGR